jgi:pimeloyl-ACP methyl ester carboxylesterase
VLVHGLGGSHRYLRATVEALAERHRVAVADLPGFGTLHRQRRDFAVDTAAGWLRDWMRAIGAPRAHVVGHSMGGFIAARLALETPDAVDRLILVAPAGLPTGQSMARHLAGIARMLAQATPRSLLLALPDALRAGPRFLWRVGRDLLAQDLTGQLGAIRAPTLVVWAEDDPLLPAALGPRFRARIPSCRLLRLPGGGHLPMLSRPREFHAALLKFLAGKDVGD